MGDASGSLSPLTRIVKVINEALLYLSNLARNISMC